MTTLRAGAWPWGAASLVSLAFAVAGASTADAAVPRQVGTLTYTTGPPGAPSGLALNFAFQNPADPSLKPHAVASMVVRRPAGGKIDTTVPTQCRASNAELMAVGPSACPADSQVGNATVVGDTGSSGPLPRFTRTSITNFNNQDEVIGVGENENLPFKPVDRSRIEPDMTTTNFPAFPGQPPPDPYMAFKTFEYLFPAYVRDGRSYVTTPPTCPPSGHWTFRIEFTYRDGVTETVESRSPCERGHPSLRIGHRNVRVDRRGTLVSLRCAGPAETRCEGTLRLEATEYDTRLRPARDPRPASTVRFALLPGSTKEIRVGVPRRTRERLARRRKAVVRAIAELDDGPTATRLLTVFPG